MCLKSSSSFNTNSRFLNFNFFCQRTFGLMKPKESQLESLDSHTREIISKTYFNKNKKIQFNYQTVKLIIKKKLL